MKTLSLAPSFQNMVRKLDSLQRDKTAEAIENFRTFLETGQPRPGLGVKKLAPDIFEFRVDIHLRVAGIVEGNDYYLYAIGSHDDIRRFLKARR